MRLSNVIVGVVALVFVSTQVEAADSIWEASSGARPDSACPRWTAAIGGLAPVISGGSMRIGTTSCSQNTHYRQEGADIAVPATLVVEARLRLESRGECVGSCGHFRDAAGINITTAPFVGTVFFVGQDEIFVLNGDCAGISSIAVDTNNSAHTYRIAVATGGAVTVSYDGTPVLTGHTYTSVNDHPGVPRILWGEASSFAYGTTHWEYVKHNAHATGCVLTSVEGPAAIGAIGPLACPNPFSSETTLRYEISSASRVSIEIFDVSGRWVRRLLDTDSSPGDYHITWDGRDALGRAVKPGPYFYRIATDDEERIGKILRLQ